MPLLPEPLVFLIDPWLFMLQSLTHLPGTILSLLWTGQLATLLSPRRLQSVWFARFWASAGPGVRTTGEARVIPLLEGRVRDGKILPPSSPTTNGKEAEERDEAATTTTTTAMEGGLSGVVLEVGPGTGLWATVFATPSLAARPITHIYGVEPNHGVHPELRRRVAAAGLGSLYEVVPCGVEDLASVSASRRVEPGSVDCIVSILCLCSIPDPERNARALFSLLKPGGRWFVYEHVRCESERTRECGLGMRMYQGESGVLSPSIILSSPEGCREHLFACIMLVLWYCCCLVLDVTLGRMNAE